MRHVGQGRIKSGGCSRDSMASCWARCSPARAEALRHAQRPGLVTRHGGGGPSGTWTRCAYGHGALDAGGTAGTGGGAAAQHGPTHASVVGQAVAPGLARWGVNRRRHSGPLRHRADHETTALGDRQQRRQPLAGRVRPLARRAQGEEPIEHTTHAYTDRRNECRGGARQRRATRAALALGKRVAVPRYHFKVHDGLSLPDRTGQESSDRQAAHLEMVRLAGSLMKECAERTLFGHDWHIEATDAEGRALSCLEFTLADYPLSDGQARYACL